MSQVRGAAPGASICTQCGAGFTCGRDDPQGCWCAALPALRALPHTALDYGPLAASACLCSACLHVLLHHEGMQRADLPADLNRADTDEPAAGTAPGCARP